MFIYVKYAVVWFFPNSIAFKIMSEPLSLGRLSIMKSSFKLNFLLSFSKSLDARSLTSFVATAKFKFCPPTRLNVAMPITLPFFVRTGLPLFPGEIGAEI